jgi:flagellin-specific chaperone FliS
MRKRIEELRDVLMETRKKNTNARGTKLNKVIEILTKLRKTLSESNDYVELKTK